MAFLDETGLTYLWKKIKLAAYPIGSIYISTSETSPAAIFGGTWEQIKDRFMLACGDTYTAGSTGGEAQHTLTEAELLKHIHAVYITSNDKQREYKNALIGGSYQWTNYYTYTLATIASSGQSIPHNNMPPFLAVYMWKRVS